MRANIGAPPTLNLQSELMLVGRILRMSKVYMVPLFLSLLFSAVYRLLLYSSTQNGYLRRWMYCFFCLSYVDVLRIFLHLLPVYLVIVKGGALVDWVY